MKLIHKHKNALFTMKDMGALERRLIDLLLANNYRLDEFDPTKFYYLDTSTYAASTGVDVYEAYRQIKEFITEVYNSTKVEKDIERRITYFRRYITEMSFDENSRQVGVKWNTNVIKDISGEFEPGSYFTSNDKVCLTASGPRQAFMEYMLSRRGELNVAKFIKVNVNYIREAIGLTEGYKLFADFRKRVIDGGLEDLDRLNNWKLEYSYEKCGKVIVNLVFREVKDGKNS